METVEQLSKAERARLLKQAGAVAPTNSEYKELSHSAGNWVYLHSVLSKLEPSDADITTVRKYLYMELTRGDVRTHIVERLHNKLNALRREQERMAMNELSTGRSEN